MSKNRPKNLSSFPEKPKPKVQYRSTSSFPGNESEPILEKPTLEEPKPDPTKAILTENQPYP